MSWVWAWLGCGAPCPPLSEVPVSGGAAAAEGEVSRVLAQLERELALPVCVDHVRIGWISGSHHRGMYNSVTRGVRVAADEPLDGLELVVRHEVCHAVDYQHDVVRDHPGVFDAADASRGEAGESFAWACQVGRTPFESWWDDGCPTSSAAEVLRDEVFSVGPTPPPGAWFEPVAGFDAGVETYFALYPTAGSILRIAGSVVNGWFDPYTGLPIDTDTVPRDALESMPPLVVPEPPPEWKVPPDSGGRLDGHRDVVSAWYDGSARLSVRVGAEWAPTDAPCPNGQTQFFALDDELWMAQLDDGWLGWGRWHAGPRPSAP